MNNVGTNLRKPTVEYTTNDISFLLGVNLESVYILSQLAHPLLKKSGHGSNVIISSVSGVTGIQSGSVYGTAKGSNRPLCSLATSQAMTQDDYGVVLSLLFYNVHSIGWLQRLWISWPGTWPASGLRMAFDRILYPRGTSTRISPSRWVTLISPVIKAGHACHAIPRQDKKRRERCPIHLLPSNMNTGIFQLAIKKFWIY